MQYAYYTISMTSTHMLRIVEFEPLENQQPTHSTPCYNWIKCNVNKTITSRAYGWHAQRLSFDMCSGWWVCWANPCVMCGLGTGVNPISLFDYYDCFMSVCGWSFVAGQTRSWNPFQHTNTSSDDWTDNQYCNILFQLTLFAMNSVKIVR